MDEKECVDRDWDGLEPRMFPHFFVWVVPVYVGVDGMNSSLLGIIYSVLGPPSSSTRHSLEMELPPGMSSASGGIRGLRVGTSGAWVVTPRLLLPSPCLGSAEVSGTLRYGSH